MSRGKDSAVNFRIKATTGVFFGFSSYFFLRFIPSFNSVWLIGFGLIISMMIAGGVLLSQSIPTLFTTLSQKTQLWKFLLHCVDFSGIFLGLYLISAAIMYQVGW